MVCVLVSCNSFLTNSKKMPGTSCLGDGGLGQAESKSSLKPGT